MNRAKQIPIGNTIRLRWRIKTNGSAVDLADRDLTLELINPKGVAKDVDFSVVDGNVLVIELQGKDQRKDKDLGMYYLNLYENRGNNNQARVDRVAFELVPHTSPACNGNLDIVQEIDLGDSELAVLYGAPYVEDGTWHVDGQDLGIPAFLVPRYERETGKIVYEY